MPGASRRRVRVRSFWTPSPKTTAIQDPFDPGIMELNYLFDCLTAFCQIPKQGFRAGEITDLQKKA